MPGIADNLLGLAALRRQRDDAIANLAEPLRLKLVAPAGPNPGDLRMLTYVPPGLPPGAPLVTVLHGCTQNAAAYDHGSGWSALAERHGFALLFPEQRRANNANLCFDWFQPNDVTRGHGEVESIRGMVEQVVAAHAIDPHRVFVTGLSAGGAMAAAMLATAPGLFAAGGIVAGLPYGAAQSVGEALDTMRQPRVRSRREWGDLVRAAAPGTGRYPSLQIWHGLSDVTVGPGNAHALVAQWSDVLGLPEAPTATETLDGARHDVWLVDGHPRLELYLLPGFGHGTPLNTAHDDLDRSVGTAGPHMLDTTLSATHAMARAWGLLTRPAQPRPPRPERPAGTPGLGSIGSVIDRAFKAAGFG